MPEISYRFRAYGAADVARAYDGISAAARRAKKEAGDYGRVASRGGPGGAGKFVREQERLAMQVAKVQEAAAKKAADAQVREAARGARAQAKAQEAMARATERAAKAQTRSQEAARASQERSLRQQQRAWERHQREAYKAATRGQRFNARKAEVRQNAVMGGIAGTVGGLGIVGGALALGGAAVGAGQFQYQIAREAYDRRELLMGRSRALSTSARGVGQTAVDPGALTSEAIAIARGVRGTKAEGVLEGQQRFVAMTGDLAAARRQARTFAIAARASGAQDVDIASTGATLREKFGITDEKQMRSSLARLMFQGKSGAFEMGDASRYFTELGASGQRFGLDKGAEGIATLGGLAQLSRMSTGSGAEASTATQAMLRQLVAKAEGGKDSIKSLTGAEVFTDKTRTKTRNVKDVLVDVIGGGGGDLTKMQKIFGEEGIAGVSKLISTFNEAANAAGKNASASERRAAGEAAVRKLLDDTINAGGDWGEVLKDAAANTDSYTERLSSAFDSLMADLGDAVAPAGEAFSELLLTIADSSGPFIDSISGMAEGMNSFVKFLQNKGIIDKPKDKDQEEKSKTPFYDLEQNQAQQAALEKKKKQYGGLKSADRRKLAQLKEREVGLREQVDAETGGPATATEQQAAGIRRKPMLWEQMQYDDGAGIGISDKSLAVAKGAASQDAAAMTGYGTGNKSFIDSAMGSVFGAGTVPGMLFGTQMQKEQSNLGGSGMSMDQLNAMLTSVSDAAKAQKEAANETSRAAAALSKAGPPGGPVVVASR